MSKASEIADAKLQGMTYALEQIEKIGLEEFKKEMKWRCNHRVSFKFTVQEFKEALVRMSNWHYETCNVMFLLTLWDEYDFSKEDLHRLNNRMSEKMRCLNDKYATWDDYKKILKDETGIDVSLYLE